MNREIGITIVIVTHDFPRGQSGPCRCDSRRFDKYGVSSLAIRLSLQWTGTGGIDHGLAVQAHEEYVVLDRAEDLADTQRVLVRALHIEGKATMEFDGDQIIIKAPKVLEPELDPMEGVSNQTNK